MVPGKTETRIDRVCALQKRKFNITREQVLLHNRHSRDMDIEDVVSTTLAPHLASTVSAWEGGTTNCTAHQPRRVMENREVCRRVAQVIGGGEVDEVVLEHPDQRFRVVLQHRLRWSRVRRAQYEIPRKILTH